MPERINSMNNPKKPAIDQIVVFTLDSLIYGLPLHSVVMVIHAMEIRPLSNGPEIITGIINVRGQVIPVADVRKRFSLPDKEIDPDDRIVIAETGKRRIAFIVSSVTEIKTIGEKQFDDTAKSLPFMSLIKGIAKIEGDLILIYDLEQFLSLDEEDALDKALIKTNK